MRNAVIVAYGRSPVCRALKGALSKAHPVDYCAETLLGVLAQVPQLDPREISDLVLGCCMPVITLNLNAARQVVQRAQLPDSISAQTINRYCASSLQAVATCANAIMCGQEEIMIAGGVEDMSHTFHTADPKDRNPWLAEHCEGAYIGMGLTAENVARKYAFKGMDGMKHTGAFLTFSEPQVPAAKDPSAQVIMNNCIRCHTELTTEMVKLGKMDFKMTQDGEGKACWDCHRDVPHGGKNNLSATEAEMKDALQDIRKSQWRWDYAVASHGASFHAPQEVLRLMGDGIDYAGQARFKIAKVLAKHGFTGDVPMPDISTKAKAQAYIGLDIPAMESKKEAFMENIVPQWLSIAKENGKLLDY